MFDPTAPTASTHDTPVPCLVRPGNQLAVPAQLAYPLNLSHKEIYLRLSIHCSDEAYLDGLFSFQG